MKRLFQFVLILFLAGMVAACGEKTVKGSGKITVQHRQVSQFDRIKAVGALSLIVDVNQPQRVFVIADDNLQPYIVTKMKGKTLEISTKKDYLLAPTKPIRLQVSADKLVSIATAGATETTVAGISDDHFDVRSTGTSRLILTGKIRKTSIGITGAAQVDAHNLVADEVNIDVTGTAKASVNVMKKLNVKISGNGKVRYYGKPPIINQAVFGSGEIQHAGE